MLCSIVIRTYNQEKYINLLLWRISLQTINDYEIILVDSGSTDATIEIAKKYGAKIVHISSKEFTFGRAINRGIENTKGKYCILVSAHAYPLGDDWLQNLTQMLQKPNVALVYGKQRGDEGSKFSERQIFLKWFPERSIESQDNPFCNNANIAIKRRIWEKIPYDEELTGLEDLDWAKKVMSKGYDIAYCAEADVRHIHKEPYKQIRYRYEREAVALKRIFPHIRFSLKDFFSLFFMNIWNDWRIAYKQKCLLKSFLGILRFRFNQFYGTYRGYRYKIEQKLTKELRDRFYYPKRGRTS